MQRTNLDWQTPVVAECTREYSQPDKERHADDGDPIAALTEQALCVSNTGAIVSALHDIPIEEFLIGITGYPQTRAVWR